MTENRESTGDRVARIAELERKVGRLADQIANLSLAGMLLAAGGNRDRARIDALERHLERAGAPR